MKLKCIKTRSAHWGLLFKEGDWYNTSKIYSKEYDVITNENKYYEFISDFLKEAKLYTKLTTEEEKLQLQLVNEKYRVNPYQQRISINMCDIIGVDKQRYLFCIDDKIDIKNKYGTSKFVTSIEFIEDVFINLDFVRNDIIDDILK